MVIKLIELYIRIAKSLKDLPPLIFRLVLAYGFLEPVLNKMQRVEIFGSNVPIPLPNQGIIDWFGGSLNIPFPVLNAHMAVLTEASGVVLLTLGLATRFISVPMMFVMLVAIATVHFQHGFACKGNGFEIPFYYLIMLFSLVVTGAGKVSLDYLISRRAASTTVAA